MHISRPLRSIRNTVAIVTVIPLLVGCSDSMRLESAMRMDGQMKLASDMKVEGAMRFDGPIQIQMQGPRVEYTGVFISEALVERVVIGETRSDWILAVFGEPTARASLDDGSEIWKWAYVPLYEEKPVFAMLSTGGRDEPTVTQATTFVHLRDGIAVEAWRD